MQGEHTRAQTGGRPDGSGDSVGDVVKLEIEKDAMAAPQQRFEHLGAGGDEELESNFEPGAGVVKAVEQNRGGGGIGNVQGDDEALARDLSGIAERGGTRSCRIRHIRIVRHPAEQEGRGAGRRRETRILRML